VRLLAELGLTALGGLSGLHALRRRAADASRSPGARPDPQYLLSTALHGIDPIAIGTSRRSAAACGSAASASSSRTNNVRETLAITDRAYILYDGKILVSGTATESPPTRSAREIYLGDGSRFRPGGAPAHAMERAVASGRASGSS